MADDKKILPTQVDCELSVRQLLPNVNNLGHMVLFVKPTSKVAKSNKSILCQPKMTHFCNVPDNKINCNTWQ